MDMHVGQSRSFENMRLHCKHSGVHSGTVVHRQAWRMHGEHSISRTSLHDMFISTNVFMQASCCHSDLQIHESTMRTFFTAMKVKNVCIYIYVHVA